MEHKIIVYIQFQKLPWPIFASVLEHRAEHPVSADLSRRFGLASESELSAPQKSLPSAEDKIEKHPRASMPRVEQSLD